MSKERSGLETAIGAPANGAPVATPSALEVELGLPADGGSTPLATAPIACLLGKIERQKSKQNFGHAWSHSPK